MDEEQIKTIKRIAEALERIANAVEKMNGEGITVWGGSTMEEN